LRRFAKRKNQYNLHLLLRSRILYIEQNIYLLRDNTQLTMFNETISFLKNVDISRLNVLIGIAVAIITTIGVIIAYKQLKGDKTAPIRFPFTTTTVEDLPRKLNMTLAELPYFVRPKTTINARNGYLGTLVIGKPYSGKTKEAIEIVRTKRGDLTILVPEGKGSTWQFETVPQEIQGDVILFLDDLPNYYVNPKEFHDSLLKALDLLKNTCASVSVVATARATELDKLYDYPNNGFWAKFEKIELGTFEQTDQLIDELCHELGLTIDEDAKERIVEENDGTPKNPVIFFVDLKNKGIAHVTLKTAEEFKSTVLETWGRIYNDLSEREREVFQALDVLHKGLVIPHKVFLVDLIRKQKSWFSVRRKQIVNAIEMVREKRLITEQASSIRCDDAYREDKGDFLANIDNLVAIFSKRSRNNELKGIVLLSLKGLSDVVITRKEFIQQAVKITRKIVELDPTEAIAHSNLGILLKELKRPEEAEHEYREAIRINPDYAEAHYNLGNLLKELKRPEEAEHEYREALWRKDTLPDKGALVYLNLGIFYAETGEA
jgi:tetratricopeptide (TPR) repeat protein